MALQTLAYPPVRDNYQFTPGYSVIETKLDGGQSRKRLDVLNAAHVVQMSWILQADEYSNFMGFFANTLQSGSIDFKVSLVGPVGALVPHVARCVGGLPMLTANQGSTYFVSGNFEVDQNPTFGGTLHFVFNGTPPEKILDPNWIIGQPSVFDQMQVGDSVQVFFSTFVTTTLDGIYTISGTPGSGVIEVSGAHLINPAWSAIIVFSPVTSTGAVVRLPA